MKKPVSIITAAGIALFGAVLASSAVVAKQQAKPVAPASFAACAACHKTAAGEKSFIGPNLAGIKGRKAGSSPAFKYSPAMAKSGIVWDRKSLTHFLSDPRKSVPGTRMAYPGIKDQRKVKEITDYLLAL